MGEHLGLQWTWRLLNVFPKSCALNNSCRRVAFSIGCKLYTISLLLFFSYFLFFLFDRSNSIWRWGKINLKLKQKKKKQNCMKHCCFFLRILNFLNFEWKNSEGRGDPFKREIVSSFIILRGERKEIFVRFYEIRRNRWKSFNFHNRNLFISENNAATKIYNIHLKVETRCPIRANFRFKSIIKHIFARYSINASSSDRNDRSIKTRLSYKRNWTDDPSWS